MTPLEQFNEEVIDKLAWKYDADTRDADIMDKINEIIDVVNELKISNSPTPASSESGE